MLGGDNLEAKLVPTFIAIFILLIVPSQLSFLEHNSRYGEQLENNQNTTKYSSSNSTLIPTSSKILDLSGIRSFSLVNQSGDLIIEREIVIENESLSELIYQFEVDGQTFNQSLLIGWEVKGYDVILGDNYHLLNVRPYGENITVCGQDFERISFFPHYNLEFNIFITRTTCEIHNSNNPEELYYVGNMDRNIIFYNGSFLASYRHNTDQFVMVNGVQVIDYSAEVFNAEYSIHIKIEALFGTLDSIIYQNNLTLLSTIGTEYQLWRWNSSGDLSLVKGFEAPIVGWNFYTSDSLYSFYGGNSYGHRDDFRQLRKMDLDNEILQNNFTVFENTKQNPGVQLAVSSGEPSFILYDWQNSSSEHDVIVIKDGKIYSTTIPMNYVILAINGYKFNMFSMIQTTLDSVAIVTLNFDLDNDSVLDWVDNCPEYSSQQNNDFDDDGIGDICDVDDDNDLIIDEYDDCPQSIYVVIDDYDMDGCQLEEDLDDDNDGVMDENDNCQFSNYDYYLSRDHDGDGCYDAEDDDIDNDGLDNYQDSCFEGVTGWISEIDVDGDSDGCFDYSEDKDDDNDGMLDSEDSCPRSSLDINWTDFDWDGCMDDEDADDDNDLFLDEVDSCPFGIIGPHLLDDDQDGCANSEDLDWQPQIEQEKVEDIEQEKAADNFNSQALTISSAIIAFVSIIFWIGVMRTKKKIYD